MTYTLKDFLEEHELEIVIRQDASARWSATIDELTMGDVGLPHVYSQPVGHGSTVRGAITSLVSLLNNRPARLVFTTGVYTIQVGRLELGEYA